MRRTRNGIWNMIPQAMPSENLSVPTFNSDRSHGDGGIGQYRIMVSDTSQYWRERAEKAERELVAERDMVHQLAGDLGDALSELAAEKALADQVYEALYFDRTTDRQLAIRAYRKARGL